MAIANNRKDQSVEVIEEYLTPAKACIDTLKPNWSGSCPMVDRQTARFPGKKKAPEGAQSANWGGGILGYPATLLLLCATDAIGHGLLPGNGRSTRLDVLKHPPF
jgi:hypothetical protein